jgi:hypothetical protein
MGKLTKKQKDQIDHLCIGYCAFMQAIRTKDAKGVGSWGRNLLKNQWELGVEVMPERLVYTALKEFNQTGWNPGKPVNSPAQLRTRLRA